MTTTTRIYPDVGDNIDDAFMFRQEFLNDVQLLLLSKPLEGKTNNNLALVSHSLILQHNFDPDLADASFVEHGNDKVQELMATMFNNCKLRTVPVKLLC